MGWGLFNKIKNGFLKVKNGIINAATFVNDKIIKPYVKPIVNAGAGILDKFVPGAGTAISGIVNTGSDMVDDVANKRVPGIVRSNFSGWMKNRFGK
jgi:hypothetical protein